MHGACSGVCKAILSVNPKPQLLENTESSPLKVKVTSHIEGTKLSYLCFVFNVSQKGWEPDYLVSQRVKHEKNHTRI